jgi:hypothetical protein
VDPDTARFVPNTTKVRLEPDSPGVERERQQREVVKTKECRMAFEAAAHQLRNACRSELGEEPLPAPSQR